MLCLSKVTVTDLGAVSVHGWLPYSNGKLLRPFVLQPDLNTYARI